MNAWNARTATTANKKSTSSLLLLSVLGLMAAPSLVFAQEKGVSTAPAMYGVKEIQVQHGRIPNAEATGNCGTSSGEVAAMTLKAFKSEGLPAFFVLNAPAPRADAARIDLFPDIVTIQPREKECISWVGLSASSRLAVGVPPVSTYRNMTLTYWNGGLMISSSRITHATAINEALTKLAQAFAQQYRLDQPPEVAPAAAQPAPATAAKK